MANQMLTISSSGKKTHYISSYAKSSSVKVEMTSGGVAGGSVSGKTLLFEDTIDGNAICQAVQFSARVNKSVSLDYGVGCGSMIPPGASIAHPNSSISVRISWILFIKPPVPPEPPEPEELQGLPEDSEYDYISYTLEEWEEKILLRAGINEKCRHKDSFNEWGEIVSPPIINSFISSVKRAQRCGENAIYNSMKSKNISLSIPPFFEIKPRRRIKVYLGSDVQSEVSERVEIIEINQKGKSQEFIITFKAESGQYYEPKDFKMAENRRLSNLQGEIDRYNQVVSAAATSTEKRENLKFARVEIPHPDGTYDINLLGLNEALKRVQKNRNIEVNFLKGDTVLLRMAYGSNHFPEIAAMANFEFPEEHLHEFEETPEVQYESTLYMIACPWAHE